MTMLPRTGEAPGRRRSSLVPILAGVLGLQACLYVGLWIGPQLPVRKTGPSAVEDLVTRVVRSRRAVYEAADDPRPGQPAPAFRLERRDGRGVTLADVKGARTCLVFIGDGSG
jgi:hypothetical protein